MFEDKKDTSELVAKARQSWLIEHVKGMDIRYPITYISKNTGYGKGTVSSYLSSKSVMSFEFFKTVCKLFEIDADAANFMIIDRIKKGIYEEKNEIPNNPQNKVEDVNSHGIVNEDSDIYTSHTKTKEAAMKDDKEFIKWAFAELLGSHKALIAKIESTKLKHEKRPKDEAKL